MSCSRWLVFSSYWPRFDSSARRTSDKNWSKNQPCFSNGVSLYFFSFCPLTCSTKINLPGDELFLDIALWINKIVVVVVNPGAPIHHKSYPHLSQPIRTISPETHLLPLGLTTGSRFQAVVFAVKRLSVLWIWMRQKGHNVEEWDEGEISIRYDWRKYDLLVFNWDRKKRSLWSTNYASLVIRDMPLTIKKRGNSLQRFHHWCQTFPF